MEVLLGRGERHLRPQRPLALGEVADQAEPEGGVGDGVGHRRSGREQPVLHAQVGHAVGDVVDRPVPAVDRAVVQPELVEGRGAAGLEHLERVLLVGDRQQGREVADVLLEQVEDRGDPALAEPHARADALRLQLLAAGVGRLLEERDARLAPQLLAEQEGRVGRHRELDAGDRLGGVPVGGELVGRGLHVELGAGAGGLGDDRVGGRGEPLATRDADRDVLAAGGEDLLGQQLVARVGAQARGVHVSLGEGRQDADHHLVGADLGGLLLGVVERAPQALLERRQPTLAQLGRREVDLDVELAELGLEVGVGDRLEHLGVLQRRVAGLVDEVELHLQPGHRVVGVEARVAQHPREHVEVATHLLPVPRAVRPAELLLVDLFSHARTLVTRPPRAGTVPRGGSHAGGGPAEDEPSRGRSSSHRSGEVAESSSWATSEASEWVGSASRHRSTAHHASAPSPDQPGGERQHGRRARDVARRQAAYGVGPQVDRPPGVARDPATPRLVAELARA